MDLTTSKHGNRGGLVVARHRAIFQSSNFNDSDKANQPVCVGLGWVAELVFLSCDKMNACLSLLRILVAPAMALAIVGEVPFKCSTG